uniref:Odorant binding protein n=1 Tax=Athetis dissimilis TaxID=1737331 RepID=A0A4D6Q601_ATHDI|nr:odorant binding protein [Athetis dissimilis]
MENHIFSIVLFVLFSFAFLAIISFEPMSKEEHMKKYNKMTEDIEPFKKNITECAHQVKASMADVENFLQRIPQANFQGKCFVACILKRNAIIKNNKISKEQLLETNRAVYGEDSEVMARLKTAIRDCTKAVDGIFEICEYASVFNDCMHIKMEHILDQVMMERRMEAIGKITTNSEQWGETEDEIMKLVKDEL